MTSVRGAWPMLLPLVLAVACDPVLPPQLELEDVAAELVRDRPDPGPDVRWGQLDPGEALRADGGRQSLIVPPGRPIVWRVTVPDGGVLRFGFGVEGDKQRDPSRAALRFAVSIDGKAVFGQDVNPAVDRRDRRWFDARLDLGEWHGRTVDLTLTVASATPGASVAGTAGWSRVRLVRATSVSRTRASPEHPNVVVVLVDTLRADAVGPHDRMPSATPRLDALASRGLVFTHAVAQSSWTLQSVASLMTGLHSRTHGALGRHDAHGADAAWGVLGDTPVTWAEVAARAGITPIGVSANPLVSRGTNLAQGFETFVELPWDPGARTWAHAGAVNDAFFRWLRGHDGYRFVAYLHYMEPHDPYTPPRPPPVPAGLRPALARGWIRDVTNRINWEHAPVLPESDLEYLRDCYRGEVAAWDEAFGALLGGLRAQGLDDRTVLVVTADHGEEFQEHGRLTHGSHLYEETVRVPLILQGPGIPIGRRDDQAQGIDLYPTLTRLLGTQAPTGLSGRDLLAPPAFERPAVLETSNGIAADGRPLDLIAVRTLRWKLVETPGLPRRELYDLTVDPGERRDLAGSSAADELVVTLARWRDATPEASDVARDPALEERLRALGYMR